MKDIMQIAGLYLLLINGVGFMLMGIDKRRAKRGAWRISEKSLFLPPLLGGTVCSTTRPSTGISAMDCPLCWCFSWHWQAGSIGSSNKKRAAYAARF